MKLHVRVKIERVIPESDAWRHFEKKSTGKNSQNLIKIRLMELFLGKL